MTDENRYSDFVKEHLPHLGVSVDDCRRMLAQTLKKLRIARNAHVLDIGGGSGTLAAVLASEGCRVTLLEVSRQNVEYAKRVTRQALDDESLGRIRFVVGDLTEKEVPDGLLAELRGPFDVITNRAVWEHLTPEQCGNLLRNCQYLVASDGYLYIETQPTRPLADVLRLCRKRVLRVGGGFKEAGIHINEQSYASFRTSLAKCTWAHFSVEPVLYDGWLYGEAKCNLPRAHPARLALPIIWCVSIVLDALSHLPLLKRHLCYGLAAISKPLA